MQADSPVPGPIVRIKPNEVHIRDPAYYEVLYSNNQKIERDPWFYGFLPGNSVLHTIPSDLYRLRRSALSKLFSTSAMDKVDPLMQDKVRKLLARLSASCKTGKKVDLAVAFRSVAMDISGAYAFPNFQGYLDKPDLGENMQKSHTAGTTLMHWKRHSAWIHSILRRLPVLLNPAWDSARLDNENVQEHYRVSADPFLLHSILTLVCL